MHTITFTLEDDDGEEVTHKVPAKYEVCSHCSGSGSHVNSNIDGNGITASEWDEMCDDDPDFPEDYMSGKYDVTCEECKGLRVSLSPDEENMSEEQKELVEQWYKYQARESSYDYEDAYTRRMEGGY